MSEVGGWASMVLLQFSKEREAELGSSLALAM